MLGKLSFGKSKKPAEAPKAAAKPAPKAVPAQAAPVRDEVDAVDPMRFVAPGQNIMYVGIVWKLNTDADATTKDEWLKRKMWLTSVGGLFYYSHKHDKPLGRTISGLRVNKITERKSGHFAFEVHPPKMGAIDMKPTVLATDTPEERDVWIKHLHGFETAEDADDFMPLEMFSEQLYSRRRSGEAGQAARRMSFLNGDVELERSSGLGCGLAVGKTKSVGPSIFSEAPPEARMPSPKMRSFLQIPGAGGSASSGPARSSAVGRVNIRRNSQMAFAEKMNTALILDWDDTIFPTTWVREDCGMNWKFTMDAQLEPSPRKTLIEGLLGKLLDRVEEFMREANAVANVIIVTLARRPWVQTSSGNFLAGLWRLVEQYGLRVIYAQEYIPESMQKEYAAEEFKSCDQLSNFWMRVKAQAISSELENNYKTYNASWKNIISFGDSDFERFGTIAAGEEYMRRELGDGGEIISTGATAEGVSKDGHLKKLRTKTVKMLSEPTVEELTAEMTLLTRWIKPIVKQDSGFDVELESTDDNARLMELNKMITGEDEVLSWAELAGMTDDDA